MERLKCYQALEMVNQATGLEYRKMYQTEKIALAKSAFLAITEKKAGEYFSLLSQEGNLLAEQTISYIGKKETDVEKEIALLRQSLSFSQREEFDQLLVNLEKAKKRSENGLAGARKRWELYRQQKEEDRVVESTVPWSPGDSLKQKAKLFWEENYSTFSYLWEKCFSFFKPKKWKEEKENLRCCFKTIKNALASLG